MGVKHSRTLDFFAQARMAGVLFADRLSMFCARPRYVPAVVRMTLVAGVMAKPVPGLFT